MTARRKTEAGVTEFECTATRTFDVARGGTNASAERLFLSYEHLRMLNLHFVWHKTHDPEEVFRGEAWLGFHELLVRSFAAWRAFFGYPEIEPWDGAGTVPVAYSPRGDGTGDPRMMCTAAGNCALPSWFTLAGGSAARGNDTRVPCYAFPTDGGENPTPLGQTKLGDFRDARELGCVLSESYHIRVHGIVNGSMAHTKHSAEDPIFWRWHLFLSTVPVPGGSSPIPSARAAAATLPTSTLLGDWQIAKAAGPPGITWVLPFRDQALAALPSVTVLFWEDVMGVTPAALTVAGHPATVVDRTPEGWYVFSGFPSPGIGPVPIALAGAGIADGDGQPLPDHAWSYTMGGDRDADGIPDATDACLDVADPDQRNSDAEEAHHAVYDATGTCMHPHTAGDALGDACDDDDDDDGLSDTAELGQGTDPLDPDDPDGCPADAAKTTPGVCGCGDPDTDADQNGIVDCVPGILATPECDDDDPCTSFACGDDGRCEHRSLTGLPGATCVCTRRPPGACSGAQLPKRLTKKETRACKLLSRAATGTKPRRVGKLLKKAGRAWEAATRAATKPRAVKGIPPTCVEALRERFHDAGARTTTARAGG
jgi:hypothetical protein